MSEPLLHVADPADWARRGSEYLPAQFETDGFIHCCRPRQLAGVVARYFADRTGLIVLSIDPTRVIAPIRYENLVGGNDRFPHIYGPLNVDAVVAQRVAGVEHEPHEPSRRKSRKRNIYIFFNEL